MKKWFTSDWHLGEDRLGLEEGKPNLFYRPFRSTIHQDHTIIDNFLESGFEDGDELWHLGDVVYKWNADTDYMLNMIKEEFPNSKFNLIVGNYDEDKLDLLGKYFDLIWNDGGYIHLFDDTRSDPYPKVLLNHYPIKCKQRMDEDEVAFGNKPISFAITGHIHGLWKVQKKMINVGVDAWHFKPVSEKEIEFCMVACEKYYDKNVFPYD